MNHAILDVGGTVMQFVGDAVMACFGAPVPQDDHADRALAAAVAMLRSRQPLNDALGGRGRPTFGLGIGLSTGPVAAALLGSEERLEYTLVGDTVNLAAAAPGPRPAGGPHRAQRGDAAGADGAAGRVRAARRAGGQGPRRAGDSRT